MLIFVFSASFLLVDCCFLSFFSFAVVFAAAVVVFFVDHASLTMIFFIFNTTDDDDEDARSVKVLGCGGSGTWAGVIAGIEFAIFFPVVVVSSLPRKSSPAETDHRQYAVERDGGGWQ